MDTLETSTDDGLSPSSVPTSTSPKPITVDDALTTIGAICRSELGISAYCHWEGNAFLLEHPKSWQWGFRVRNHVCKQDAVTPGLKMMTDDLTWWIAAKTNRGLASIGHALSDEGLVFGVETYCDGASSAIALTSFEQIKQLALDHGLICGPQGEVRGVPTVSCGKSGTILNFAAGQGFDGIASFNGNCPDRAGVHGWIWAGDGYSIDLSYSTETPTTEVQALKDALGGDSVWCEL